MELKGKTALVTGSCREGMGRSTALRLARDGANVVLNYGTYRRDEEVQAHAEKIAAAISDLGGRAIIQPADTADGEQVKAMVEAACEAFGQVDILVNNAGGGWVIRDYADIPLEDWKSVLAAEIDGAFLTMKYILPGMRERGWGRIIHLGMHDTFFRDDVRDTAPDYCLGKAARAWMTRAFGRRELDRGVTVNCIAPGLTAFMSFEEAVKAASGDLSDWRGRENLNCHDVAELVAFLCSDAGRFISGSVIELHDRT